MVIVPGWATMEVRWEQSVWACLYTWRGFGGGLPLRDHSPTIVKSVCPRSAGREFEWKYVVDQ